MAENDSNSAGQTGYIFGGDLLLKINGKCVGHCTSHKITYKLGTRTVAVKAPATETTLGDGAWEETLAEKQSIDISFDGLRNYDEMEGTFEDLLEAWGARETVEVEAFRRGEDEKPYLVANALITQLDEDNPADGDSKYSGQMKVSGKPTKFVK